MNDLDEIVAKTDYDTKLAITAWVMKHIVEHATEGGSYRYLIYDRLGFGPDAYVPLCEDGLTISNEFDLQVRTDAINIARENGYDKMKPVLGLCDEPDCYDLASCFWQADTGYRRTCTHHMILKK